MLFLLLVFVVVLEELGDDGVYVDLREKLRCLGLWNSLWNSKLKFKVFWGVFSKMYVEGIGGRRNMVVGLVGEWFGLYFKLWGWFFRYYMNLGVINMDSLVELVVEVEKIDICD